MNHAPAKGSRLRLAFALLLVVWLTKLALGIIDVMVRHVPDYPDAVTGSPGIGQVGTYVVVPAVFVLVNAFAFVFARQLPKWAGVIAVVLQAWLLAALLLFSTGGV